MRLSFISSSMPLTCLYNYIVVLAAAVTAFSIAISSLRFFTGATILKNTHIPRHPMRGGIFLTQARCPDESVQRLFCIGFVFSGILHTYIYCRVLLIFPKKKRYKQYTCTWCYGHYHTGILVQHWLLCAQILPTSIFVCLIIVILSPRFSMDNY